MAPQVDVDDAEALGERAGVPVEVSGATCTCRGSARRRGPSRRRRRRGARRRGDRGSCSPGDDSRCDESGNGLRNGPMGLCDRPSAWPNGGRDSRTNGEVPHGRPRMPLISACLMGHTRADDPLGGSGRWLRQKRAGEIQLRSSSIGLIDVVFQSITYMAPGGRTVFSIGIGISFAGTTLPLSVADRAGRLHVRGDRDRPVREVHPLGRRHLHVRRRKGLARGSASTSAGCTSASRASCRRSCSS